MTPRSGLAARALALLLLLPPSAAPAAEFSAGVDAYEQRDFAAARAVFEDLAALGDGPSQYNLGAMALRGEGVAKDRGEAAGWMLAARENGHDPTPRALDDLRGKLTDDERARADVIVARFGRAALARTALPDPLRYVSVDVTPPRLVSGPRVDYPERWGRRSPALVVMRTILAEDGRLHEPEVIVSIPPIAEGGRPFVEAAVGGLLARRYEPARENGRPISVWWWVKLSFAPDGPAPSESLLDPGRVKLVEEAAAAGDARAQFLSAVLDLAARKRCSPEAPPQERCEDALGRILSAAQAGVPEAQLFVGRDLASRGEAARALPWLSRASSAGLPDAHVAYGLALAAAPELRHEEARALLARGAESSDPLAVRRAVFTLACARDVRLRSPEAAYALSKRVDLGDDPDPLAAEAVAAARAAVGKFSKAADAQRLAVKRAKKLGRDVHALEERLRDYEAERPCSEGPPANVADIR